MPQIYTLKTITHNTKPDYQLTKRNSSQVKTSAKKSPNTNKKKIPKIHPTEKKPQNPKITTIKSNEKTPKSKKQNRPSNKIIIK